MPVTIQTKPLPVAKGKSVTVARTTVARTVTRTANVSDATSYGASRRENSPADNEKVCWIEMKHYPYQPDHQVELLHLQAEADALLIELQATGKKQRA